MKRCKKNNNKGREKFATRKCFLCSRNFDVYSEFELKFFRFCIHCKSQNKILKGHYL